ncbi:60S ribosomal protein L7a-like isoform X2 [Oppia nitens]|uniref:60S ribosomal protein L7a-like isoform X2 n=1 Tax=Oppia nitens TaxID=1686743 RepID=UPI0023DC9366|nr:60S ribosomal protein L7a-like isoform X2 [Oppia nitens]
MKKITKKVRVRKVAPLPTAVAAKTAKDTKKTVDPLIQKKPKNFGIGGDIQPKRDLTRFFRWPRYIRVQRQRAILLQRLKIPPTINQFRSGFLDRQTATQLFRLLDKYRPESKKAKKDRLKKEAENKAAGKESAPSKRPPVLRFGVNTITTLVEKKKAQLVAIAADVEPIELVLHLPSLCRKMGVPYCVVRGGRSRLGHVTRRKGTTAVAFTNVNPEDKVSLTKLVEVVKTNFNDRFDEIRRQWGGGILGAKSRAKISKLEKAKQRELGQLQSAGGPIV